jgi:F-type H+-transporting ATPase subunit epsilon
MELQVLMPFRRLLTLAVTQVNAEGPAGCFCLLPGHVDWVTTLVPGILSYGLPQGGEGFVAVDEGLLVKQGTQVVVTVRRAVADAALETLRQTVERTFLERDARERQARTVLARLESSFVRGLVDLTGGTP